MPAVPGGGFRRGEFFESMHGNQTASLPELEQIIVLEIDTYNHSTHEGIADRPLDRYLAYYRRPDLPEERRVPPLLPDRDRWIGYSRAREILAELERVLRSERRERPDNLLVVGASNQAT
jgi:hypothetical protein